MLTRILSAAVLIPIVVSCLYMGGLYFLSFLYVCYVLGWWEWSRLMGLTSTAGRLTTVILGIGALEIISFRDYSLYNPKVLFIGSFVFWLAAIGLIFNLNYLKRIMSIKPLGFAIGLWLLIPFFMGLRYLYSDINVTAVIIPLVIVWISDSFAYFYGRKFGRTKLLESVSPNKTVEGMMAGFIGVLLFALVLFMVFNYRPYVPNLLIFLITSAFGVLGDLFESACKRINNIKDSGKIIPGHGGILDRIDSLLAAIPVFALGQLFII